MHVEMIQFSRLRLADDLPRFVEPLQGNGIVGEIHVPTYIIRRKAVDFAIPLITDMRLAQRFVEALVAKDLGDLAVKSWDEYA